MVAKAATNWDCPAREVGAMACSMSWAARPLLSPEISWLDPFMEVACTENQFIIPIGLFELS